MTTIIDLPISSDANKDTPIFSILKNRKTPPFSRMEYPNKSIEFEGSSPKSSGRGVSFGNVPEFSNSNPQFSFDASTILNDSGISEDFGPSKTEGVVLVSSNQMKSENEYTKKSKKSSKKKSSQRTSKGVLQGGSQGSNVMSERRPASSRELLPVYTPSPTFTANTHILEDDLYAYSNPAAALSLGYKNGFTRPGGYRALHRYYRNDNIVDVIYDFGADPFRFPYSILLSQRIHTVSDILTKSIKELRDLSIPEEFIIWCKSHGISIPEENFALGHGHDQRGTYNAVEEDEKSIFSLGNVSGEPHVEIVRKDIPIQKEKGSIFSLSFWLNKIKTQNISIRCENNKVRGEIVVKIGKRRIIMHTVHNGYTVSDSNDKKNDYQERDEKYDDEYSMIDLSDLPGRIRSLIKDSVEVAKAEIINQIILEGNISQLPYNHYSYIEGGQKMNYSSGARHRFGEPNSALWGMQNNMNSTEQYIPSRLSRFGKNSYLRKSDDEQNRKKKQYVIRFDEEKQQQHVN